MLAGLVGRITRIRAAPPSTARTTSSPSGAARTTTTSTATPASTPGCATASPGGCTRARTSSSPCVPASCTSRSGARWREVTASELGIGRGDEFELLLGAGLEDRDPRRRRHGLDPRVLLRLAGRRAGDVGHRVPRRGRPGAGASTAGELAAQLSAAPPRRWSGRCPTGTPTWSTPRAEAGRQHLRRLAAAGQGPAVGPLRVLLLGRSGPTRRSWSRPTCPTPATGASSCTPWAGSSRSTRRAASRAATTCRPGRRRRQGPGRRRPIATRASATGSTPGAGASGLLTLRWFWPTGDARARCRRRASSRVRRRGPGVAAPDDGDARRPPRRAGGATTARGLAVPRVTWCRRPARPEWVAAVNRGDVVPITEEAGGPFDRDELLAEARARMGLADGGLGDFGDPGFVEPLDRFIARGRGRGGAARDRAGG